MRIGVPKEIKIHEYRVGMTPAGVREATAIGHEVVVEQGAGDGVGFSDDLYAQAGARILPSPQAVFDEAELIVKVKEPQAEECKRLKPDQCLFTYLHLAADSEQADALMESGCIAIAYETITDDHGALPLLRPMSEVAGRMSVQVGAAALQKNASGAGKLLGGVPGVAPSKVLILGGGVAGSSAAEMAIGLRADVTIFDSSVGRLKQLDLEFRGALKTVFSTQAAIEQALPTADLVIGTVLIPGASAPKLVSRNMLGLMRPGSVLVDVAIDQGGCFETSRVTTHSEPTYVVDGIVHYCVANMPGAVAHTSTLALTNATLPYVLKLANEDVRSAVGERRAFRGGLNVAEGQIAHPAVAAALKRPCIRPGWHKQEMR